MVNEVSELRAAAQMIFQSAINAVDAREATRAAITLQQTSLKIRQSIFDFGTRPIYSVAVGKAAHAMAVGLTEALSDRLTAGVISGPTISEPILNDAVWTSFYGGHPFPNQQSLDAAHAAMNLLKRADAEHALVIFLISGGGSAMLELPRSKEITLHDLVEANRQLVSCGATISEINVVRRAFSASKGGGLANAAPNAKQITLIVSDTNPGDEASVASGPTHNQKPLGINPRDVVQHYRLYESLPPSIIKSIEQPEKLLESSANYPHYVLLSNETAVQAAAAKARELGFVTEVAGDINEQPIEQGCELLLSRLAELATRATHEKVCLISGGEFACPVRGDGVGGRNLETVLRCAINLAQRQFSGTSVVMSAGTDGIDGNSLAAGAVADQDTVSRALALGLEPRSFLDRSDAFTFFDKLGDKIVTGTTGTNVRDIRILLS